MFTKLDDYKNKYRNIKFERKDGILLVTFTTDGGPLKWSAMPDGPQHEAGAAFFDIGHDPENRIVILNAAGDRWCTDYDLDNYPDQEGVTPLWWDYLYRAERDLFAHLLDIPVPVIGCIPGPATYHAEIPLLSDVVLASDDAYFRDDSHVAVGVVPGDGIQVMWQLLVGVNRARSMQYLHQTISVDEGIRLGFVAEKMPREKLLPRAYEVAYDLLAKCSPVTLRNSRSTMIHYIRTRLFNEHMGSYALEGLAQVMRPQLENAPDVEVWHGRHANKGSIKIGHDIKHKKY